MSNLSAAEHMTAGERTVAKGLFCEGGLFSTLGFGLGTEFLPTWLLFVVLQIVICLGTSGPLFYKDYWPSRVTYKRWLKKTNPQFPSVEKVRDEIVQTLKCIGAATICPALSIWLAGHGRTQAYCGITEEFGIGYHVMSFLVVMLVSDFWEFYYHYLGHKYNFLWQQHRHHHKFFNPSPFAVIADEFVDQFMRSTPLLILPLVAPVNIDMLFFEFGTFFYLYGCYLHWGFELDFPDAHNPVMNTAYHHYAHHAKSIVYKPYYCGFFFKIWDQLFGSTIPDGGAGQKCFCCKCQVAQGKRSEAAFRKVEVPKYEKLLQPSFWLRWETISGATSTDKANHSLEKAG